MCLLRVEIASHARLRHGIFSQRLDKFLCLVLASCLLEHNSHVGASVHGKRTHLVFHSIEIGFLHALCLSVHLVLSEIAGIHPTERALAWQRFLLLFIILLIILHFFGIHELQALLHHLVDVCVSLILRSKIVLQHGKVL